MADSEIISPAKALTREIIGATYFKDDIKYRHASEILLGQHDQRVLGDTIALLSDPFTQKLIEEGKITFCAIKPNPIDSKLGVQNNIEGENKLFDLIKPPLEILYKITISPTPDDIQTFYPKKVVDKISSFHNEPGFVNNWESYKHFLLSGPITYFMLYDPHGNAVDEWRIQIGATDPKKAHPDSFRGKYALSINNNLFHGSAGDTREENILEVTRERNWLLNKLNRMYYYNSQNKFNRYDLVPKGEIYLASKTIYQAHAVVTEKNGKKTTNYHPC